MAPPETDCGSKHAGGSVGVVKAGAGGLNSRQLDKESPTPLKQPKQPQPSPAEPGSAKLVVVGSGANKQLPEGSIAGIRSLVHPVDITTIQITTAAQLNRPIDGPTVRMPPPPFARAVGVGSALIRISAFIDPSYGFRFGPQVLMIKER